MMETMKNAISMRERKIYEKNVFLCVDIGTLIMPARIEPPSGYELRSRYVPYQPRYERKQHIVRSFVDMENYSRLGRESSVLPTVSEISALSKFVQLQFN
jgi:hypothetical protein